MGRICGVSALSEMPGSGTGPAADCAAPGAPRACLAIGVTGHRPSNAAFAAHHDGIAATLDHVLDLIAATAGAVPVRLHCLLSEGTDLLAACAALARGWELAAPLPFGQALNIAINAAPVGTEDAQLLLAGKTPGDPQTAARAADLRDVTRQARLFELAERDPLLTRLLLDKLAAPADLKLAEAFSVRCSARVALAGRVMIEQSDLLIGVWDGASRAYIGGTGHTILQALEHGAPVLWIDARDPDSWRILHAPEALAMPEAAPTAGREAELARIVHDAVLAQGDEAGQALAREVWHPRSNRWWTGYRRVEALFSGAGRPFRSLTQTYESPASYAQGSGAPVAGAVRALPGGDPALAQAITTDVLPRFAWIDGVSVWLADAYRGGMTANFMLSALAVVGGLAYQPLADKDSKWMFAALELAMLSVILLITWIGGRRRWHGRWFETRRVAEYLRHAPILLPLGVARAPGRWPQGGDVTWPEFHARHALRALGLPRIALTPQYLRHALGELLDPHVVEQRDYHELKAQRLTRVHHNLDRFSTRLFQAAVVSVTTYLLLGLGSTLHLVPHDWPHDLSYLFTFLGVAFPTFGAAIAGIRYFGDFERFAAISEVTAAKLDAVHARIGLLLQAGDDRLDYARVAELAHATDDIVVDEIENWQAVFGGKHIAVPV